MIKVGVYGATGYAGVELIKILARHPEVEIVRAAWIPNKEAGEEGKKLQEIFPHLQGVVDLSCGEREVKQFARGLNAVFLAVPHKVAMSYVPDFLAEGVKVIDFSADYRLTDVAIYEKWYQKHTDPKGLAKAVYGLPELYREKVKKAQLIANPGCYPTVSILSLAPLIKNGLIDNKSIVIDAKSGISGAGRAFSLKTLYTEASEGIKAYALNSHRHQPEIEQELSKLAGGKMAVTFVPHLAPMNRGILATIYADAKSPISRQQLSDQYASFYKAEHFVRLAKEPPSTKQVSGTNNCDIYPFISEDSKKIIITSAIDNLVKGAAGQAVQNMNLMCGLDESLGLRQIALFP